MYLDSNKRIEIKLNVVPATECQVVCNYFDKSATTNTLSAGVGNTSGTGLATLVSSPTGSLQRAVQNFYIFNPNTGSVQATIIHNYNGNIYTGWKGIIASEETVQWDSKNGYH